MPYYSNHSPRLRQEENDLRHCRAVTHFMFYELERLRPGAIDEISRLIAAGLLDVDATVMIGPDQWADHCRALASERSYKTVNPVEMPPRLCACGNEIRGPYRQCRACALKLKRIDPPKPKRSNPPRLCACGNEIIGSYRQCRACALKRKEAVETTTERKPNHVRRERLRKHV